MIFHTLAEPEVSPYLQQFVARVAGRALDPHRMRAAWAAIVERHESFRASFTTDSSGTIRQRVEAHAEIPLVIESWRGLPAGERAGRLDRYLRTDRRHGFDLARAPLHRLAIFPHERGGTLVWTTHHTVLDGRSRRIVLAELAQMLAAGPTEAVLHDAPAPSFGDFADWLAARDADPAASFWRTRLAGIAVPYVTALTRSAPEASTPDEIHGTAEVVCSSELSARLKEVAARLGVGPTAVLHAAWALVLSRHGSSNDVLFGAARAGRRVPFGDAERLVGLAVNTVPVRVTLREDESAGACVRRIADDWQAAAPYETAPLSAAFRSVHLTPGEPPFESFVTYERGPLDDVVRPYAERIGRWRVRVHAPSHYPLSLTVTGGDRVRLELAYDRRRVGDRLAARVVRQLETTLNRLTSDLDRPVGRIDVVPPAERRTLCAVGAKPVAKAPRPASLFEMIAAHEPSSVPAVEETAGQVSYRELLRRVDLAARALAQRGVGPDVPVGVWNEHSAVTLVALLGIVRAGGAIVPLEPGYPAAWLDHVVRDAGLGMIIATRGSDTRGLSGVEVTALADLLAAGATAPPVGAGPDHDDLAYILYTSGSTGRPKGVAMPHRSFANLIAWQCAGSAGPGPLRTLQHTPLAFDVGLQETFATLAAGGTLVLAAADVRRDVAAMWALIVRERIERIFVPPVLLDALARAALSLGTDACRLRAVISAGEQLRITSAVRDLFALLPGCRLENQYGPTETHVVTAHGDGCVLENQYGPTETCQITAYQLRGDPRSWPQLPPIGGPIPHARVVILDPASRLVPAGAPGEICIGGVPLARGYWGNPEMTAARFVPDPTARRTGRRLYRTGDLGRRLEDGTIEFLGRLDDQLKVRGCRVEPQGVEAVLQLHPAVQQAVVAGRPSPAGSLQLVAWVVPRPDTKPDPEDIKRFAADRLPAHEVPTTVVTLDDVPLTPTGKIDRRRLPDPQPSAATARRRESPRSQTEADLVALWEELLGIHPIGVEDSFTELGGDSLGVLRLMARLPDVVGRSVPVRDFLAEPTIAALARCLEQARAEPAPLRRPQEGTRASTARGRTRGLSFAERPIEDLIAAGAIPPVEAAALSYLPDWLPRATGRARLATLLGASAFVSRVVDGPLGRLAVVTLPVLGADLYRPETRAPERLADAVALATRCGAQAVSLAGLIPSATGYGQRIAALLPADRPVALSTGHAATAAAVVAAIQRTCKETGRALGDEDVGFVGLGSVGLSTLRLLLRVLPHPRSLVLCDLPARVPALEALRREIAGVDGFGGEVAIAAYRAEAPDRIYESTMVVGATNVERVLDVARLAPGTVVVDDSGPHCFDVDEARRRLAENGDLLCVEGGVLSVPGPLAQLSYFPPSLRDHLDRASLLALARFARDRITGCVLSSLLTARHGGPATLGVPTADESLAWWSLLSRLEVRAAPLHLEGATISKDRLRHFEVRHGGGALRFWQGRVDAADPSLDLPRQNIGEADHDASARIDWAISARARRSLRRLEKRAGAPGHTALLAAFLVLLGRVARRADVMVDVATGASWSESGAPASFPLRIELAPRASWSRLLAGLARELRACASRRHVPRGSIARLVAGDPRAEPLFSAAFAVGATARPAGADLTFVVTEHGDRTTCSLLAAPQDRPSLSLTPLARALEQLVKELAERPDRAAMQAPLMDRAARRRVAVDFNRARWPLPPVGRLERMFEAQAARTPRNEAIGGELAVSYGELARLSDHVAGALAALGVRRGATVGLCIDHSPALVAGVLGILRAAGVCVPIEPETPPARLRGILDEVGARVVVTGDTLAAPWSDDALSLVRLDRRGRLAGGPQAATRTNETGDLDDRAFVFFTSGSTGSPKGVVQTHRQCCYGQLGPMGFFGVSARDRVLLRAPISTSGLVCEVFWGLLRGGRTVVAEGDSANDPERLVATIERHGVTIVLLVPSLLRALLDQPRLGSCRTLRHVCSAGDVLDRDLAARALALVPARLSVIYGTTEAPSTSAAFIDAPPTTAAVEIGFPLPTKRVFVVDQGLQLLPAGMVGELVVGGRGIAAGYWGRPDLTRERFVADPGAGRAGDRLFRTGDLARFRPDGGLEHLGRADQQVKVRGLRVEPAEIEAALRSAGACEDAAVVVRDMGSGERRLVAYVVASEDAALEVGGLRARLRERLPEHMVPGIICELDSLPRTRNGKLDRAALPAPAHGRPRRLVRSRLRTPAESLVARLWRSAFGDGEPGRDDDFFAHGGDSLHAALIVNRLRALLAIDLPLRAIFDHPTLSDFAGALASYASDESVRQALAAVERGVGDAIDKEATR